MTSSFPLQGGGGWEGKIFFCWREGGAGCHGFTPLSMCVCVGGEALLRRSRFHVSFSGELIRDVILALTRVLTDLRLGMSSAEAEGAANNVCWVFPHRRFADVTAPPPPKTLSLNPNHCACLSPWGAVGDRGGGGGGVGEAVLGLHFVCLCLHLGQFGVCVCVCVCVCECECYRFSSWGHLHTLRLH